MACELCDGVGGELIWRDAKCRTVRVIDVDYPAYCRVIWHDHAKEMTDLAPEDRLHLMRIVFVVEQVLRDLLHPDKINLASLGNMTPHLHWHVIPRFGDDRHFPRPVWGQAAERTWVARPIAAQSFAQKLRGALNDQIGDDIG